MASDMNDSSTSTTLSYDDTFALLRHLDDEASRRAAIVFVYLVVLMASGLPGNVLVIVVYATKFKATTTRSFVIALAALDLLNCLFGIPEEVVDLYRSFTYPSLALCKIDALLTSFSSISSGNILVVLAADRYRRVCRPLSTQLTLGRASAAIMGCCLLAVVLAWPFPVLYGFLKQTTRTSGVVGRGCDIQDAFSGTAYPLVHDVILLLVFVTSAVTFITLYSLVFKQIRRRFQACSSTPKVHASHVVSSTSVIRPRATESCDGPREVSQHRSENTSPGGVDEDEDRDAGATSARHDHGGSPETQKTADVEANRAEEVTPTEDTGGVTKEPQDLETTSPRSTDEEGHSTEVAHTVHPFSIEEGRRRASKGQVRVHVKAARNTTLTLFLVTLVYILSFLPYLAIMALHAVKPGLFSDMNTSTQVAYELFVRSYYVQNAANPFIYGFLNTHFRRKCREILRWGRCR